MNEAKHTTGPWRVGQERNSGTLSPSIEIVRDVSFVEGASITTYRIGSVIYPTTGGETVGAEERKANARLIAAAPENLQSNYELAMIVRELCAAYGHPLPEAAIARSDAAIAKATGGADSGQGAQRGNE